MVSEGIVLHGGTLLAPQKRRSAPKKIADDASDLHC